MKGIEFLESLPSPYKEQTIKNVQDQFAPYLEVYHPPESGILSILSAAFLWDKSPEGCQYWSDLCEKLIKEPIEIPW